MDATSRAWQQILEGAREAYDDQPWADGERGKAAGVPLDSRCPSCGVSRDGCGDYGCIRAVSPDKEMESSVV